MTDPRGDAVESGHRSEADERPALAVRRSRRRPGPQVPRPSTGSRIIAVPDDRARLRLRVGFGAHQHDADGGDRERAAAPSAPPTKVRSTESIQAPTGRAASNQELAVITTPRPSSASRDPVPAVSRFDLAWPGPPSGQWSRPWPASARSPAPRRRRRRRAVATRRPGALLAGGAAMPGRLLGREPAADLVVRASASGRLVQPCGQD